MKDTKRRLEWFSFYDHTGIEAHLERMAAEGWLLEKFGGFTWHYRRTEPKKLTFSVSYFPKASQFDPGPSQEQETFYDFCAHTGWTLAASSAQMQFFYNERPDPVPIDTDPALEVDAIHRSAKKSFLLPQLLLLAVGVMNFGQFLWRLFDDPVATLSSPLLLFSLVCWPVLFLMLGTELVTYFRWRGRARKAAEQGEFLPTKSHPAVQLAGLAVVTVGLIWCLAYLRGGILAMMMASLAGVFGSVFVVVRLREELRRNRVPAGINRAATIGACVALPLVMVVLVTAFVLSAGGRIGGAPEEPPLTLADLAGQSGGGRLDQNVRRDQSPLLAVLVDLQHRWRGTGSGDPAPVWLGYTVIEVKAPFLYDLCRDELLAGGEDEYWEGRAYAPRDPAPWGAEEAYELRDGYGGWNQYLLCYPGRLVEIGFDSEWEVTPAQMAMVGEKLGIFQKWG